MVISLTPSKVSKTVLDAIRPVSMIISSIRIYTIMALEINVEDYVYVGIVEDEGTVLLENKETKTIMGIPMTAEVLKVFNIENDNEEPVSQSLTNVNTKSWSERAIKILIHNYKVHENLFRDNTTKNETVWKKISEVLKNDGFNYTITQIINKWKHLKKLYMKQKDNMGNKCTGEATFTFNYFEPMDEIFDKNPNVQPVAIASSSKGSAIDSDVVRKSFEEKSSVNSQKRKCDDENISVPTPKKPKFKNPMMSWLEERDKDRDKRHKENMELQKEAMNDFKTIMTKFLDKL